ncbi:Putative BEN domain-containing protein B1 [Frankliniella fusca]|uniref:BEN domain-containing protein B1 n=1 Tax=Frankliniella fusca TaxID=407009 RepID=A0AAE1GYE5_9NEOP|nr:Putative BEN domain-containing protein B1 [Frankliniella fusca]
MYFLSGKKRKRSTSKRAVNEIQFDGPMFAFKDTDKGAVKLVEDRDVYINEKVLKKAKSSCCSPSHLTRFLTRAVFTSEAKGSCSVSGKPSLVKGQVVAEVRTKLDQEGVEAILEYVEHRSSKKGWRVPTASAIKQYMANVLCEERAKLRLADESSAD